MRGDYKAKEGKRILVIIGDRRVGRYGSLRGGR
jgi:hypothetical protein